MTAAPLWTAADAAAATDGRNTGEWVASGVSIDSRTIQPGELFVALKGPRYDGHEFIQAAFLRGAAAAMVERAPDEMPRDAPVLQVHDTLEGLTSLGAAARARAAARVAAITGSVGKTGTKEALRQCLAAQASTAASAGSLNNHWGVPLSLARMPPEARYGVFELGMNHAGEIAPLARLVRPHVAVITNVEMVHLEFFNSVDAIADAKAEIFEGVGNDGTAVLNRDSTYFTRLASKAKSAGIAHVLGFGEHPEADIRLVSHSVEAARSSVTVDLCGSVLDYSIALPGTHWIGNSLAVLGTAHALGADVGEVVAELARLKPLQGRGERHIIRLAGGTVELIDDSYNANPASMRAAIKVLGQVGFREQGRRIAVLGDMLELGEMGPAFHAALAVDLEAAEIDLVFTCGSAMSFLHRVLPHRMRGSHAANSKALTPIVVEAVRPGDVVLVKGSAGSRTGFVVDALKGLHEASPSE